MKRAHEGPLTTLFDFNGVLIDDEHLHFACMRDVLADEGVALSEADYFGRYFALDDAGAFRAILNDAGHAPTTEKIASLVHAKKPVYLRRAATEAQIFPGAKELLRAALEAGPVAIVSGALRHEIEAALVRMELLDNVNTIVSAEDTRACKPDPEGYRLAIEALANVADRDVVTKGVAIEDSPGGVRAAKAAGLSVIAVLHSVDRAALLDAGADHVVDRVGEIDVTMLREVAMRAYGV